MEKTMPRNCLSCGRTIQGRADKKFCSDHCRSAFNNRLNSTDTNKMRMIDNWLRKNRRIMQQLLGQKQAGIFSHATLSGMGFVFHYCTHTLPGRQGSITYYCYEYGYAMLENGRVQLVRKKG